MYRKNLFGDITAIYDRDTCVAKYAYDAYGVCKVMNPDGTENTDDDFIGNVNPIRYRGYYYDVGTGFYYLQTRYYDPQTGRFLNMDGLEYLDPETAGGLNLYAYCGCDPINYYDPTGTFVLTLTSSAIFFGYLALAGIAITGVLYWESKTHAIGNLVDDIGSALGTIGSSNDNVDTSLADEGALTSAALYVTDYYLSKKRKKKYKRKNAAIRKRVGKKTNARDAARKAGGGKEPIHHPYPDKNGKGHYHPNVKGPHQHDHYYYYSLLLLLLSLMDDYEDDE